MTQLLGKCPLSEVRILKAEKNDHICKDLAAYERDGSTLLVTVKFEYCTGTADNKQYPKNRR